MIKSNKKDEAQIIFDLKKELGFKDQYFEKKINYLFGYTDKIDESISEKSLFYFHLAYEANPNFIFEPKDNTDKIIWKYLSSSNLLNSFQEIDISELVKLSTLENAVHNKNYLKKIFLNYTKDFNLI